MLTETMKMRLKEREDAIAEAARLRAALLGLVKECAEAIKTEEWDSDNAAFHAALVALRCQACEGEGATREPAGEVGQFAVLTCPVCKDARGVLPFGYTSPQANKDRPQGGAS